MLAPQLTPKPSATGGLIYASLLEDSDKIFGWSMESSPDTQLQRMRLGEIMSVCAAILYGVQTSSDIKSAYEEISETTVAHINEPLAIIKVKTLRNGQIQIRLVGGDRESFDDELMGPHHYEVIETIFSEGWFPAIIHYKGNASIFPFHKEHMKQLCAAIVKLPDNLTPAARNDAGRIKTP
jgi:hypothetical protein